MWLCVTMCVQNKKEKTDTKQKDTRAINYALHHYVGAHVKKMN